MKRISFKMRIAAFTGVIVLVTAVVLTGVSMYNAGKQINLAITAPENTEQPVIYTIKPTTDVISEDISNDGAFSDVTNNEPMLTYTITAKQASRRYNISSIVAMFVITAAGMAAAYIFAGKSLKPIRKLSCAIAEITEKDLSMRLPAYQTKDEISSLTNSFNAMLDRLDGAFEHQKRFSSSAAHELKTPVAVIETGLQTLRLEENPNEDDYKEVFKIVIRNTKRLANVIDDLMLLTNESTALTKESVSLNALLIETVQDVMPPYRKKDIHMTYDLPAEECFIICVESLAYRLFYNLIENAFKYNKQHGSLHLSINENKAYYEVHIKDSGIGIPSEQTKYIWEAFYCVDPSRSRKLGGAGLGLSIVKEIADSFGWHVSVNSNSDEGCEFIVTCAKTDCADLYLYENT